jgi:hypothetical protein
MNGNLCARKNNNCKLNICKNIGNIHCEFGTINIIVQNIQDIDIIAAKNNVDIQCNNIIGDIIDNGENVYINSNNYLSKNSMISIAGNGNHNYCIRNIQIKEINILENHIGLLNIDSDKIKLEDNFYIDSNSKDSIYQIFCNIFEAKRFCTSDSFKGKLLMDIKNYASFVDNTIINDDEEIIDEEKYGFMINSNNNNNIFFGNVCADNIEINVIDHNCIFTVHNFCKIYDELKIKQLFGNFKFNSYNVISNECNIISENGLMNINIDSLIIKNIIKFMSSNNAKIFLDGDLWNCSLNLNINDQCNLVSNIKKIISDDEHIIEITGNSTNSYVNINNAKIIANSNNKSILHFNNSPLVLSLINTFLINKSITASYNITGRLISSKGDVGRFLSYYSISNLPIDDTIITNYTDLNLKIDQDIIS